MTKATQSNYELLRLQRIERNNQRLKSLGLLDNKPKPTTRTPTKKTAKKRAIISPSPRRTSRRLQNQPALESILEEEVERKRVVVHRPSPRRIIEETPSLSAEQRAVIHKKLNNRDFIDSLREYLVDIHRISESNLARVMRSMEKLAAGEGVRAPHWPDNCYFLREEKVTAVSNVGELIERGRECEEEWGRDLGNGWLYNHPLRKLALFQSHLLEV